MANESNDLWKNLIPQQTEETRFKSYFYKDFWTLLQFAALAAGLDPLAVDYTKSQGLTKEEEHVRTLLKRFFVDIDRGVWGDKECRVLGDKVLSRRIRRMMARDKIRLIVLPVYSKQSPRTRGLLL